MSVNQISNLSLKDVQSYLTSHKENFARISQVAVPFLQLHHSTGMAVTMLMGAKKSWEILTHIRAERQTKNWTQLVKDNKRQILIISAVGIGVLYPTVGLALSHGVKLAVDIHHIAISIYKLQGIEAAKGLLSATHTIIYVGSILYATPEMVLASLVIQALMELYSALRYLEMEGCTLEGVGKLLLACVRLNIARNQFQKVRRDLFGIQLDGEDFEKLLRKIKKHNRDMAPGEQIDLDTILAEKNISGHFKNLFLWDLKIKNIKFEGIRFHKCYLDEVTFSNVSFVRSQLSRTEIIFSKLKNVQFVNTVLDRTVFSEVDMKETLFSFCLLIETQFRETTISHSSIRNSYFIDTFLLDNEEDFTMKGCTYEWTRPVVGVLSNGFDDISERLNEDFNVTTVPVSYSPKDIDKHLLNQEVEALLEEVQKEGLQGKVSILQAILHKAKEGSQVHRIHQKAQKMFKHFHALVLFPGEDVQPEIYGQERGFYAYTSSNYRRTITEGAYLDQALEYKAPVLGICHGSQISNVFRGGSLIQHVDGHFGRESTLSLLSSVPKKIAAIALRIFGDKGFLTTSMHHQASDPNNLGKGLHVVLEDEGVPKALVSEDGLWVLTQFHPEEYPDYDREQDVESNRGIFAYFVEKANAYRHVQP